MLFSSPHCKISGNPATTALSFLRELDLDQGNYTTQFSKLQAFFLSSFFTFLVRNPKIKLSPTHAGCRNLIGELYCSLVTHRLPHHPRMSRRRRRKELWISFKSPVSRLNFPLKKGERLDGNIPRSPTNESKGEGRERLGAKVKIDGTKKAEVAKRSS